MTDELKSEYKELQIWKTDFKSFIDALDMPRDDYRGIMEYIDEVPIAESEIIRCKDCKHKPHPSDEYDYDNGDCGYEIIFPDYRCPCRCEDEYYNYIPDDDWYCGNAERKEGE